MLDLQAFLFTIVLPKGFEPLSLVPETNILSIELRKQFNWNAKLSFLFKLTSILR